MNPQNSQAYGRIYAGVNDINLSGINARVTPQTNHVHKAMSTTITRCLIQKSITGSRQQRITRIATSTPAQRLLPTSNCLPVSRPATRNQSTSPRTSSKPSVDNARKNTKSSDVEVPVFDFKSLGLKGPVKVVVITVICILSTIETAFWVKVGWRWWNGESEDQEDAEEEESLEERAEK